MLRSQSAELLERGKVIKPDRGARSRRPGVQKLLPWKDDSGWGLDHLITPGSSSHDTSPGFAIRKIALLFEDHKYEECAALIKRLSNVTLRTIVSELPVEIVIEAVPHSLPILEALYCRLFTVEVPDHFPSEHLLPDKLLAQLVRWFSDLAENGTNHGKLARNLTFHLRLVNNILKVIAHVRPGMQKKLRHRQRALTKCVEKLGRHGLVDSSEGKLTNLQDALKIEFQKTQHQLKIALQKLETLNVSHKTPVQSSLSKGPAPTRASHQRMMQLNQLEVQERLIKNKTLLNVVEPIMTSTYLSGLIQALQTRIEYDKEVLFYFTELRKDMGDLPQPCVVGPLFQQFGSGYARLLSLLEEACGDIDLGSKSSQSDDDDTLYDSSSSSLTASECDYRTKMQKWTTTKITKDFRNIMATSSKGVSTRGYKRHAFAPPSPEVVRQRRETAQVASNTLDRLIQGEGFYDTNYPSSSSQLKNTCSSGSKDKKESSFLLRDFMKNLGSSSGIYSKDKNWQSDSAKGGLANKHLGFGYDKYLSKYSTGEASNQRSHLPKQDIAGGNITGAGGSLVAGEGLKGINSREGESPLTEGKKQIIPHKLTTEPTWWPKITVNPGRSGKYSVSSQGKDTVIPKQAGFISKASKQHTEKSMSAMECTEPGKQNENSNVDCIEKTQMDCTDELQVKEGLRNNCENGGQTHSIVCDVTVHEPSRSGPLVDNEGIENEVKQVLSDTVTGCIDDTVDDVEQEMLPKYSTDDDVLKSCDNEYVALQTSGSGKKQVCQGPGFFPESVESEKLPKNVNDLECCQLPSLDSCQSNDMEQNDNVDVTETCSSMSQAGCEKSVSQYSSNVSAEHADDDATGKLPQAENISEENDQEADNRINILQGKVNHITDMSEDKYSASLVGDENVKKKTDGFEKIDDMAEASAFQIPESRSCSNIPEDAVKGMDKLVPSSERSSDIPVDVQMKRKKHLPAVDESTAVLQAHDICQDEANMERVESDKVAFNHDKEEENVVTYDKETEITTDRLQSGRNDISTKKYSVDNTIDISEGGQLHLDCNVMNTEGDILFYHKNVSDEEAVNEEIQDSGENSELPYKEEEQMDSQESNIISEVEMCSENASTNCADLSMKQGQHDDKEEGQAHAGELECQHLTSAGIVDVEQKDTSEAGMPKNVEDEGSVPAPGAEWGKASITEQVNTAPAGDEGETTPAAETGLLMTLMKDPSMADECENVGSSHVNKHDPPARTEGVAQEFTRETNSCSSDPLPKVNIPTLADMAAHEMMDESQVTTSGENNLKQEFIVPESATSDLAVVTNDKQEGIGKVMNGECILPEDVSNLNDINDGKQTGLSQHALETSEETSVEVGLTPEQPEVGVVEHGGGTPRPGGLEHNLPAQKNVGSEGESEASNMVICKTVDSEGRLSGQGGEDETEVKLALAKGAVEGGDLEILPSEVDSVEPCGKNNLGENDEGKEQILKIDVVDSGNKNTEEHGRGQLLEANNDVHAVDGGVESRETHEEDNKRQVSACPFEPQRYVSGNRAQSAGEINNNDVAVRVTGDSEPDIGSVDQAGTCGENLQILQKQVIKYSTNDCNKSDACDSEVPSIQPLDHDKKFGSVKANGSQNPLIPSLEHGKKIGSLKTNAAKLSTAATGDKLHIMQERGEQNSTKYSKKTTTENDLTPTPDKGGKQAVTKKASYVKSNVVSAVKASAVGIEKDEVMKVASNEQIAPSSNLAVARSEADCRLNRLLSTVAEEEDVHRSDQSNRETVCNSPGINHATASSNSGLTIPTIREQLGPPAGKTGVTTNLGVSVNNTRGQAPFRTTSVTGINGSPTDQHDGSHNKKDTDSERSTPSPAYYEVSQSVPSLPAALGNVERKELESLKTEVKLLRKELVKCRETVSRLQEREKSMRDRLCEQAQRQLGRSGTKFENLSLGENRPTSLIRRYGNLYSEVRVDAFDALDELPEMAEFDDLKGKLLFSVVVLAFRSVQQSLHQMETKLRRILYLPKPEERNESNQDSLVKELEETIGLYLRKSVDKYDLRTNVTEVSNQVWNTLYDYPSLKECGGLRTYIEECVRLAWALGVQSPPYLVDYETRRYNPDMHTRFHTSEPENVHIKSVLWPALMEGPNGPCVHKGVVIT